VPDRLRHQCPAGHLHPQRPAVRHGALRRRRALLERRQGAAQERAAGRLGVDLRAAAGMTENPMHAEEDARPPRLFASLGPMLAALALITVAGAGAQDVSPEQIATGARIFARNCSPCHGPHMRDPESAFDLRKFPHDAHDRFVSSVTHGKNQMPPWGDLLKAEEIEALWSYVVAGEK